MTSQLPLGLAAAALVALASAGASAANLVNRGGSSDVPTFDDRVYYIKPSGASCPSGFICFCDSGSSCKLPSSPSIITGTVVIDRPGVTLDCQNRVIQAPRFGGSDQQCTASSQCGQHSSGSPKHACVNGYCQLGNLAGINVGGPLKVDDGAININVNATGFVQDVQIRNCKVRNHYAGYVYQGFEGDNGLDGLEVYTSELYSNQVGLHLFATDNTEVWGNYVHDNIQTGMDLEFNWQLKVSGGTVASNGSRQIYFHGTDTHTNRWLDVLGNTVSSAAGPLDWTDAGNVLVLDLEHAGAHWCLSDTDVCDLRFEINDVIANNGISELELRRSHGFAATTLVRMNRLTQLHSVADILVFPSAPETFFNDPRCWDKDNVCYRANNQQVACKPFPLSELSDSTCWY
jgi:hypothetical protein